MKATTLISLTVGSLLALCTACHPSQSAKEYVVEGVVRDSSANGKTIYIMRYDNNEFIDSTVVKDNRFTFKGQIDTAVFCRIDVTYSEFANFILEGGHIQADLETWNYPHGTPLNEERTRFQSWEDSLYKAQKESYQAYRKRYKEPEEFKAQWDSLRKAKGWDNHEPLKELFMRHNNDALGLSLIYGRTFHDMSLDEKLELLAHAGPWVKSTKIIKRLQADLDNQKKTTEGQPFVDINGKDIEGKDIALSDFIGKGNYVLLDMWASWCAPCKAEIPYLAQLHNRYKDKGLTVIGLFTWDKAENLPEAIKSEKITWPQIIDTDNQGMKQYGVGGIPHIILFSPDGTILKRGLRGDFMIKTVENILSNKK